MEDKVYVATLDNAFAKWLLKILSSILTGLLAHVSPTNMLS